MNAITCQQFTRWQRPRWGEEVGSAIDQLSVDICLDCTEDRCDGAPCVGAGRPRIPQNSCPYEQARARRIRKGREG